MEKRIENYKLNKKLNKDKKEQYKLLEKKTSIWDLYGFEIIAILIMLSIIVISSVSLYTGNFFLLMDTIFKGIALVLILALACLLLIGLAMLIIGIKNQLISDIRQTKIPLTKKELDLLNIKSAKEYSDFLEEYLIGREPNCIAKNKILFMSYYYFGHEDIEEGKCSELNEVFKIKGMNHYGWDVVEMVLNDEIPMKDLDWRNEDYSRFYDNYNKMVHKTFGDTWLGKQMEI